MKGDRAERCCYERHILKHGVESSFGMVSWSGVESGVESWSALS